jgi:flagellin-specific chaperone FliS
MIIFIVTLPMMPTYIASHLNYRNLQRQVSKLENVGRVMERVITAFNEFPNVGGRLQIRVFP